MTKKMLIDATHKEEIRVAITEGNKLIEYDYESLNRKPLKGSIFLAKVTRVEPSLQAAFVNFGGNRHGFLPFSEIHPDYFRIPVSDRDALMEEQEELLKEHDEEQALEEQAMQQDFVEKQDKNNKETSSKNYKEAEEIEAEETPEEPDEVGGLGLHDDKNVDAIETTETTAKGLSETSPDNDNSENQENGEKAENQEDAQVDNAQESVENETDETNKNDKKKSTRRRSTRGRSRSSRRTPYRNRNVEVVGGDDVNHEQRFRFNLRRKYKIQEVIKRGQIMLIQANKEERGNKGAAVGSYLSLPGRYCVLMPNSPRAGGVSRKIANPKDRARMREIVRSLEVPKGMSVIVRTAGVSRTKNEIKRDLDYLMRLWNNIRELTLESTAPSLVYEEADLIKRAVRDLYTRDVEEIIISGEDGYKIAKNFMKMMIPSHVKKVIKYEDTQLPLFNRYQIESQISEIGQPEVRLKSGGYLVINPTEALVAIDVNSGKATKGRHIEETALKTNLESADEIARQLKLRDLGGLVVVDFIDMEDRRNNTKVERRMKEALSSDRARVQVGRISSFGLMELSRQRLSPSLTEAQYEKCPTCNGIGVIPSADAMSITVLRAIEEEGIRARAAQIIVCVNNNVALYLLNHKRKKLTEIENRYDFEVLLRVDDKIPACEYRIEVSIPAQKTNAQDDETTANEGNQDNSVSNDTSEAETASGKENTARRNNKRNPRNNRSRSNSHSQKNDEILNEQAKATAQNDSTDNNSDKETVVAEKEKTRRVMKPRKKPVKDTKSSERKEPNVEASQALEQTPEQAPEQQVPEQKEKPAAKKKTKRKTSPKKKDAEEKTATEKTYEVVNQPPKEKKKGWWNKLVD
ncbi:MAG: ribonuclease E/G [Alphaproteobacteria bacterium]|nr:ribonuclease E/G [Alphaproteobacteria bacterium]